MYSPTLSAIWLLAAAPNPADAALPPIANPAAAPASEIKVYALANRDAHGAKDKAVPPFPPPLPAVPPSEAVAERAPANEAIRPYPAQADGHGIKLGGINQSRWAEDWRIMRDPSNRDDPLDRLKYLPIDANGDAYLTLSGEVRVRANYFSNPGLVPTEHRREDRLRLVAGADLHVGPFRLFGEMAHGGIGGHNFGTAATNARNDLVAQQAFGELSGAVGTAMAGIRYGRQEFTDGPPLLVSQKDNNTIRAVLDGSRAWAQLSNVRLTLFDFAQVRLGAKGLGDDASNDATRFSGATVGVVLANDASRKMFLDPFVWRERTDQRRWGSVTAKEVRYYSGARLWGSIDRLTLDWTVNHQSGRFDGRDIDAWNFFIAQTYALPNKGPKLGIHVDYGSGGSGGVDGTGEIGAVRNMNGGATPYSYQGALNIINLLQISPNVTFSPRSGINVTLEYQHSRRNDQQDAVYRGNATPYAGTQLVRGHHIGDGVKVQAGWSITKRLSLTGRYEYFGPGDVLTQLGYEGSHYLAGWLSFRL